MIQPPKSLESGRLRLRRSAPDDAAALFRVASDQEVMRFMDWPMPTQDSQTREYLEGCAERWEAGEEYHWVIEVRASNEVIGAMSCRIDGHKADFGYFLARHAWGQGYATEAGNMLVDWLRGQSEILRIWATTDYENRPSARVLEKLGLQLEGVMRLATFRPNIGGRPRDALIYGFAKTDI